MTAQSIIISNTLTGILKGTGFSLINYISVYCSNLVKQTWIVEEEGWKPISRNRLSPVPASLVPLLSIYGTGHKKANTLTMWLLYINNYITWAMQCCSAKQQHWMTIAWPLFSLTTVIHLQHKCILNVSHRWNHNGHMYSKLTKT